MVLNSHRAGGQWLVRASWQLGLYIYQLSPTVDKDRLEGQLVARGPLPGGGRQRPDAVVAHELVPPQEAGRPAQQSGGGPGVGVVAEVKGGEVRPGDGRQQRRRRVPAVEANLAPPMKPTKAAVSGPRTS